MVYVQWQFLSKSSIMESEETVFKEEIDGHGHVLLYPVNANVRKAEHKTGTKSLHKWT